METIAIAPIKFTEGAVTELKRLMNEPNFDTSNSLRIGVKGGGCSGLSYLLGFDKRTDKDTEYEYNGITFLIDKAHEIYLAGMEIEWEGGLNSRGFTFSNPNAST
ncbi:MAG: iron-sulfur cluster assembly accessory protein, partial [Bacteroidota bacterium]|nr:iron-sulfur cluster assembly accessory protein [Bacteroidota bacterium]